MTARILVVEADDDRRRQISGWLEEAGYDDVMMCPGPGAPEYTCIGGQGKRCPLSEAADVVVIDLHLRSDAAMRGTPAWHLMLTYYDQGRSIVALWGPEDAVHPYNDDRVIVIPRPIEKDAFLEAVGSFAHARTPEATPWR